MSRPTESATTGERLVKVYSHPRSGTHFLEAFLGRNFYPGLDLADAEVTWGHWADRRARVGGNPYGKLFGSHRFPSIVGRAVSRPSIYIFRDGRAVAYSVWNSEGFLHPDLAGIDFSSFLRLPLDWYGSPNTRRHRRRLTIAQHWHRHVRRWGRVRHPSLMRVRYEELKADPEAVASAIAARFGLPMPACVDPVDTVLGIAANKGEVDAWRAAFTEADLAHFHSIVPRSSPFLWR